MDFTALLPTCVMTYINEKTEADNWPNCSKACMNSWTWDGGSKECHPNLRRDATNQKQPLWNICVDPSGCFLCPTWSEVESSIVPPNLAGMGFFALSKICNLSKRARFLCPLEGLGFHKKKKWVLNECSLTLHCPCCQCCPYYLLTDQAFCWCTRSQWPASSNNKRRPQACRYPAWASKGNPRWALQKVWISKATSGFISLWSDDNLYLAPFKTVLRSEFEEKNTSSCLQAQHLLIPGRIRTTRATVAIRAEYTEFHDSHLALCFCSSRYSPCSTLHSLQGCCRRHAVGLDDKSSGEVWLPDNQTLKVCPFVRMFLKWKAWDYFRTRGWLDNVLLDDVYMLWKQGVAFFHFGVVQLKIRSSSASEGL